MKLKVWLFIALKYLMSFGLPIGVAFWRYSEVHTVKFWGSFLYFVLATIFILLIKKLTGAIKKQKVGIIKAVFKFVVTIIALSIVYFAVDYIGSNFRELVWVIAAGGLGAIFGLVFEILAINTDKEFADSTGLL